MNLDSTRFLIIKELWKHQNTYGRKGGLTAAILADRHDRSVVAVGNALKDLLGAHLLVAYTAIRKKNQEGRTPQTYLIDQNAIITWPTTAWLVLKLHGMPGSKCNDQMLVQECYKDGLMNPDTRKKSTVAQLTAQLEFAKTQGYITPVLGQQVLLTTTPRTISEQLFLQFLADNVTQLRSPARGSSIAH